MSEEQKAREDEVFDQELSVEELDAAAGGGPMLCSVSSLDPSCPYSETGDTAPHLPEEPDQNCVTSSSRDIYGGNGFPNCAATVEDGSWCGSNDACVVIAIDYKGRKECFKAWK